MDRVYLTGLEEGTKKKNIRSRQDQKKKAKNENVILHFCHLPMCTVLCTHTQKRNISYSKSFYSFQKKKGKGKQKNKKKYR